MVRAFDSHGKALPWRLATARQQSSLRISSITFRWPTLIACSFKVWVRHLLAMGSFITTFKFVRDGAICFIVGETIIIDADANFDVARRSVKNRRDYAQ
jgi:hypothetical protein